MNIYIVYVTYFIEVEVLEAFNTLEQAEARQLELMKKWVNSDQFNIWFNKSNYTIPTLEAYNDYYLEVEDDCYVGIKQVILNNKQAL